MRKVAVLASGNGSNLQALLDRIRAGDVAAQVVLVAGDKPEALALARARKAHVPAVLALPPEGGEKRASYDARLLEVLRASGADSVVLAGYMRIVGDAIIDAFPGRIVNIHPSLLPSFRGLHAVQQAHEAGVGIAGCTTHIVTSDLDGGPILLQAALPVRPAEGLEHLQKRILALEHVLLPRTVDLLARGRIRIEHGKATIRPAATPDADSWLRRPGIPLVSGAMYGEGF